MIVNGRVIYSLAGWINAQYAGSCALCGAPFDPGARILRVNARGVGSQYAGTCCAAAAEEASGHWHFRPNAPRESSATGTP